ncbi:hypothetical protein SAPIO_CDS1132 [Scedosporium apiospermum]|uniref:Tetraspanin tsp3 n=1 Tax=Pseudallescheria apiosperma TaxID=563466 RepID=A0A084GFX7_PSEDA|nr:uncharacterized protein SAPIO_CDS1132 [Scedosporium apiospermum]KEZ46239.1 hypothetical protein SAPIO_CDS1132 [Scedosporium apiospermum]
MPKQHLYFYALIFLCLALTGIAVTSFIAARNLSLPIPTPIILLPIILPLLFPPLTLLLIRTLKSPTAAPFLIRLLPPAHLLLLTVIATLLGQSLSPNSSNAVPCPLFTHWQSLYSAHDATRIRRIQDTLECCGLRSVRDMAWPFDSKGGRACVDTYGRNTACGGPWEGALRGVVGADLGVVLGLAVLQIIITFLSDENSPSWLRSLSNREQERVTGGGWRLISHPETGEVVENVEDDSDTEANNGARIEENGHREYGTMGARPGQEESESLNAHNQWRD